MQQWQICRTKLTNEAISDTDYLISIDETGTPTLKNLNESSPKQLRWFTISCCIFNKDCINDNAEKIMNLKNNFWQDGNYHGHRIYLHSRDIRRKQGPFNLDNTLYSKFINELGNCISDIDFTVCSASIDKWAHVKQYSHPAPVYDLALKFMLERIVMFLSHKSSTGILLLECRGWKEDNELLSQIVAYLKNGTGYFSSEKLKCIKGIYFEKKRTKDQNKSYWPFELSDIAAHNLNEYAETNEKTKIFSLIEPKIIGYPNKIDGRGIKKFP